MSLKKHQRYIGYIQLRGTWPSVHKGNSKSEISLLKIFSPKQTKKTNQILSATLEKIKLCLFKKNSPCFL